MERTREVGGFRFAAVVDGVAADGAPVVDVHRGWITEPARRERILQYLRVGVRCPAVHLDRVRDHTSSTYNHGGSTVRDRYTEDRQH